MVLLFFSFSSFSSFWLGVWFICESGSEKEYLRCIDIERGFFFFRRLVLKGVGEGLVVANWFDAAIYTLPVLVDVDECCAVFYSQGLYDCMMILGFG